MDTRLTKSFYKIKEVSEIIGVSQSTLRFWEKEFAELRPKRNLNNRRSYTPADVEVLQIINYLVKIKGLKIDAAKEELKHNKKNISKKLKIVENLKNVREDLVLMLDSLNLRGQKIDIPPLNLEI